MNHFKRLMVERRLESIQRLTAEIRDIDGKINQLSAHQWFRKRQLRIRHKLLRSYIKTMAHEIEMASS